jgi:hypothetical protein
MVDPLADQSSGVCGARADREAVEHRRDSISVEECARSGGSANAYPTWSGGTKLAQRDGSRFTAYASPEAFVSFDCPLLLAPYPSQSRSAAAMESSAACGSGGVRNLGKGEVDGALCAG